MSITTRADWHPERALRELDHAAVVAGERVGDRVLSAAQGRVPYATGELASTAIAEVAGDGTVTVGYASEYAAAVRARGSALNGRDPGWLDTALDESQGDVVDIYASAIRQEWS